MALIDFKNIKYYSRDAIYLEWNISNLDGTSLNDYKVELYRSEIETSGFKFVCKPNINDFFCLDCSVNTRSKNRKYFYKLKLTHIPTGDATMSPVDSIGEDLDIIGLDIVRRERLLLREYLQNKIWIYIPRLSGVKCQVCYDEYLMRRTTDECKSCYGTGFECGFYNPIPSYIAMNPPPKLFQVANFGPMEQRQTNAWITCFPRIPVNSYIFEIKSGDRWRVSQITTTQKRRSIVRQLLRLTQEDMGSIIYDIKLPDSWVEPW